jgi:hypothetical protein
MMAKHFPTKHLFGVARNGVILTVVKSEKIFVLGSKAL